METGVILLEVLEVFFHIEGLGFKANLSFKSGFFFRLASMFGLFLVVAEID